MRFTEPEPRQFVAYTPPQRMEGPDGEAITAGSQTFVTYYKGIKVANVLDGGYNATKGKRTVDPSEVKTVRVEFDPESVGFEHAIAANIAPSDPAVEVLRNAMENDEAVNVAIESVRMHKNRDTKELISPLTPIHALMGASTPGGKANMTHAGNTTSRVIAAVNGETTVDCRSDATQWASLSSNRAGNLPPEGFRLLTDKDDWTQYAVIVPTEESRRAEGTGNGTVDLAALAQLITDHLDEKLAIQNRQYIKRPQEGEIGEGRPYSLTTLHDAVSMGSFLNSKFRYIFEWAYGYLKEIRQSPPEDAEVFALVDVVLDIADHAQVKAYGGNVKVDQEVTSHTEACRWTQWAIANHFTYTPDVTNEWKGNVRDYVADKMTGGAERIARDVLKRDSIGPREKRRNNQQAQSAPAQNAQAPAQQQTASNDERMENVRKCLEAVNKNWDNVETLRKVYKHARSLKISSAPVALVDGKVVFDRNSKQRLAELIIARGEELSGSVNAAPAAPAPAPADNQPEETSPVEDAPAADEAMNEDDFASALGATTDSGDWGAKLEQARTSEQAQALWNQAQASLNESVEFRGETVKLGDAFTTLSNEMTQAQEIVEEVAIAEDTPSLNKLRVKAKREGLLDYEVLDGVSDDPVRLLDAIMARREALSKGD